MLGGGVPLRPVEVGVATPAKGRLVAGIAAGIGEGMVGRMWTIAKGQRSQNLGQGVCALSVAVKECGWKR